MPSRRALYLFAALTAIATIASARVFFQEDTKDFLSFYLAARAVGQGLDPYDVETLRRLNDGKEVFPYLYSPLLAVLAVPLAKLSLPWAFRLWTLGGAVGFALTGTLALARPRPARATAALLVALVLGAALDVRNDLLMGQVNTYVLVPLTLCLVCRERPGLAGASLAVAGLLKSSPFALVALFVAERRWRLLAIAAATTAVLAALTLPVVGIAAWRSFFAVVARFSRLEVIPGLFPYSEYSNFSFAGILSRATANDAGVSRAFAGVIALAATVPIAIAAWRRPNRAGVTLSVLVVMVLSSPLAYVHHVVYVLPGAALLLLDAVARDRKLHAAVIVLASTAAGIDFGAIGMATGNPSTGVINALALLVLYLVGLRA